MKRVLVIGNTSMVGSRFVELMGRRHEITTAGRTHGSDIHLSLNVNNSSVAALQRARPEVVVNFAAVTDVDACELERDDETGIAYKTNVLGPLHLARACRATGVRLIHISTDYVFSGDKRDVPYDETDTPRPANWYGTTKYLGEQAVLSELGDAACIVRIEVPFVARFFSKKDLVRTIIETLRAGRQFTAVSDNRMTPTFVDDIVAALDVLINNSAAGIYHVAGTSAHSAYEVAQLVAETFGLDKSLIVSQTHEEFQRSRSGAARPQYNWLSTEGFVSDFGVGILHTLPESLQIMKQQMEGVA